MATSREWRIRKLVAVAIVKLLTYRHGSKAADYWAWEMTPWPVGLPSWKQIWDGVVMVWCYRKTQEVL